MFQSPPKRRRISTTAYTPTNNGNDGAARPSNPTTPTRASYQSPTKASLARSHPRLFANATRRTLTEPRGRAIREDLLSRKGAQDGRISVDIPTSKQPSGDPGAGGDTRTAVATEPAQNLSDAVTRAFTEQDHTRTEPRSPLRTRQPANLANDVRTRAESEDNPLPLILPKLVKRSDGPAAPAVRPSSKEPDLPPTPVQLGIDPAPYRPRGLASSSSPRSSRHGSGRHRTRIRSGVGGVTSSPLKPKDQPPHVLQPLARSDTAEDERARPAEAPESEIEAPEENATAELSEDLKTKQKLLKDLRAQLSRLQADMTKLERATDQPETRVVTDDLMALLTTPDPACEGIESAGQGLIHTAGIDLGKDPLPFLRLFAPGDLQLSTTTSTTKKKKRPMVMHTLDLTAPSPWPPHIFSGTLEITVDAEDARTDSVKQKDIHCAWSRIALQSELQDWIAHRLDSPLHKLDTGGLVWGMGSYFRECIKRARTLKTLDSQYNNNTPSENETDQALTTKSALALIPYLDRGSLEFCSPSSPTKKIMLTWRIELDWTSAASSRVEIVPSGISEQAANGARDVFAHLAAKDGVGAAFDGVWNLLAFGPRSVGNGYSNGNGRKRKGGDV